LSDAVWFFVPRRFSKTVFAFFLASSFDMAARLALVFRHFMLILDWALPLSFSFFFLDREFFYSAPLRFGA